MGKKTPAEYKVEARKLASIVPYARNPRKNDAAVDKVAASIAEFGWRQPIVVDEAGVILAGHTRYKAAQKLGMETVPVHVAKGLTKAQARAYRLADNRTSEEAEWDADMLKLEFDDLTADGFDLELTGFDPDEITLGNPDATDAEPQIDKAAELAEKWGVETGQLWKLGEHRIVCGDCTDAAVVARVMDGEKATLLFTDPPYGVSIGAKNRLLNSINKTGSCLSDIVYDDCSPDDLKKMLLSCFTLACESVCADDCSVFVCSPQGGELGLMMMMMMKEAGLTVRHVLNWAKNSPTFSMGRLDYDYQHEPILFTWTKRHKRPMRGQFKTSLWHVDKPRASKEHPTMKPVELPANALLNHTDSGDIAYEPFSGSGTTLIACEQLGRKCRAIEISPGYVAVAIQRWVDATGKTPELVNG